MSSEWMKVMLDEVARKKAEAEHQRAEAARRLAESGPVKEPPADDSAQG